MQHRRTKYPVTQDSFVPRRRYPIVLQAYLVSESPRPAPHLKRRRHRRCTGCSSYWFYYLVWCVPYYPLQVGQWLVFAKKATEEKILRMSSVLTRNRLLLWSLRHRYWCPLLVPQRFVSIPLLRYWRMVEIVVSLLLEIPCLLKLPWSLASDRLRRAPHRGTTFFVWSIDPSHLNLFGRVATENVSNRIS
jgi:hypothetical protein